MKRRKFLIIFGATTVTSVGLGLFSQPLWKNLSSNLDKSLKLKIPNAPTGSLQPNTIKTLMAVTESLLQDNRIEKTHYQNFFSWTAENLSGYKDLYEKFVVKVNHFRSG